MGGDWGMVPTWRRGRCPVKQCARAMANKVLRGSSRGPATCNCENRPKIARKRHTWLKLGISALGALSLRWKIHMGPSRASGAIVALEEPQKRLNLSDLGDNNLGHVAAST